MMLFAALLILFKKLFKISRLKRKCYEKTITLILTGCAIHSGFSADKYYPTINGTYIIPQSTLRHPNSAKKTEQTFNIIIKPTLQTQPPTTCETPASLACVYNLTPTTPGCPIATSTITPATGAGKSIAIVDAYDYNAQASDLTTYVDEYGLPPANLTIVGGGAGASCSLSDSLPSSQGWQDEHILDLDMVHAMAPAAAIYMVEANSDSNDDLMNAEDCATSLVAQAGGGIVSNSWGSPESADETNYDTHFQHPGVVYLVSSGDFSAPPNYPSASPYVVSAGGTTILRNSQGNFINETGWSTTYSPLINQDIGSSGGPSLYEQRPPAQVFVEKIVGTARGTPDISFDANPSTGVCIYSTFSGGWIQEGGTSVSAPALSGILSSASYSAASSQDLLGYIYYQAVKGYHAYWNDQIIGNNGYPALAGYDFITGLGSPRGYNGK